MNQFSPVTDNLLLRLGAKFADVHIGIIDRFRAFSMERNQIVDSVHLVDWKERVDTMSIRPVANEPTAAYPAFYPDAVCQGLLRKLVLKFSTCAVKRPCSPCL